VREFGGRDRKLAAPDQELICLVDDRVFLAMKKLDRRPFEAAPTVAGGKLLVRTVSRIYCLEDRTQASLDVRRE